MATDSSPAGPSPAARRALGSLAVVVIVGLGVVIGAVVVSGGTGGGAGGLTPSATGAGGTAVATASPTLAATPSPTLAPTPEPTPPLVPSALTGLLVTEDAAIRHPIAVMIDDHAGARPQSGFNAASIVWQAPTEGGIPRYMLVFQDRVPAAVGPVRSSRQYFIEWAAEWKAMYIHVGGSSQALGTLARFGHGQYVWNADDAVWEGKYLFRVHEVTVLDGPTYPLVAPHNVYTDGAHLRNLAARIGAEDRPLTAAWTFGSDVRRPYRPTGTRITVVYPYEAIQYRYDPVTNTYRRYRKDPFGGPFKLQVDAADGRPVAPKNVVVLRMAFGPLNPGVVDPHHRLEAHDVGHGLAWISTNGVTVKGTWRKASVTAPTLLFGPDGSAMTLTAGQTFVQVMQLTDLVTVKAGTFSPPPAVKPASLLPL